MVGTLNNIMIIMAGIVNFSTPKLSEKRFCEGG